MRLYISKSNAKHGHSVRCKVYEQASFILVSFPANICCFVSVDFTPSKLNVLTWRENYAGSSGLSSAKRFSDIMNSRMADGVRVRELFFKANFRFLYLALFL